MTSTPRAGRRAARSAATHAPPSLVDGHCGWKPAGGRGRRPGRREDAGSATAELAASLPALMLLLAVGLSALAAVRTQIECVDAAREAARAAARGDPEVARIPGAAVSLTTDGDLVRATVVVRWSPLGGGMPGIDITATSVAAVEPS